MIVCFIGHRKIENNKKLKENLTKFIYELIPKGADKFLFGSKSEFDNLCYEIVTAAKYDFTNIKRIYVRSSYPYIDSAYKNYLYQFYEETYYPDKLKNAGKASYIKRNQEMINKADICIFYYNKDYTPPAKLNTKSHIENNKSKSGTKTAYEYAVSQKSK